MADRDVVETFMEELDGWEAAYPLRAFPEPDLARAAELLKAGGMTLDAVSASNMRHVVSRIAPPARLAVETLRTRLAAAKKMAEALREIADAVEGAGCEPCEVSDNPCDNALFVARTALEQWDKANDQT